VLADPTGEVAKKKFEIMQAIETAKQNRKDEILKKRKERELKATEKQSRFDSNVRRPLTSRLLHPVIILFCRKGFFQAESIRFRLPHRSKYILTDWFAYRNVTRIYT
jgi:hypothetical protein